LGLSKTSSLNTSKIVNKSFNNPNYKDFANFKKELKYFSGIKMFNIIDLESYGEKIIKDVGFQRYCDQEDCATIYVFDKSKPDVIQIDNFLFLTFYEPRTNQV